MIGVDTNILLRLLLNDEPTQVAQARARLERARAEREVVHVGPVALVEMVWTLQRRHGVGEIAEIVEALIDTPPFRVFDEEILREALSMLAQGRAGFADALIAAMDRAAGCTATLTFDKRALELPAFIHPTNSGSRA